MLKEQATLFRRLMIFCDMCILAMSFAIAFYVRNLFGRNLYPLSHYFFTMVIFVVIWSGFLYGFGLYRSFRLKKIYQILFEMLKSAVGSILIFGCVCYFLKSYSISRSLIILAFSFGLLFLFVEKLFLICFLRYFRKRGLNYRNLLIVGSGHKAAYFIRNIKRNKEFGFNIIGVIAKDKKDVGGFVSGCKIIGVIDDINNIILNNVVDQVVFIVPKTWLFLIEKPIKFCELLGIEINIAIDFFGSKLQKIDQASMFGIPLISLKRNSYSFLELSIKRFIDIILSFIAICLFSPIFVLAAILIKFDSKGSVLFSQVRCGLKGRKFNIYKFRTMTENAESQMDSLKKYNEMSGPAFKMQNDPRITKVGKILRKYSIDELPQLWNVLIGDMSMVGPRPPLPDEVSKYNYWQRRKLSKRPGITCLWQISGRNNINSFNQWLKLDLEYIDNWSLMFDFRILLRTIPAVFFGIGAK